MNTIPNGYEQAWASRLQLIFQDAGFRLKGTTAMPERVTAEKIHWRTMGAGKASKRVRGDTLKNMNVGIDKVSKDVETWIASDWVYEEDLSKMSPNMQDTMDQVILSALGRKFDELLIEEMQAQTFAAANKAGASGAAFSVADASNLVSKMRVNTKHARGEIFCAIPPKPYESIKSFAQFSSRDYVTDTPYARMADEVVRWNGITWIPFPEDGLNKTGADIDFFAWHRESLGYGDNNGLRVDVSQWSTEDQGYLHAAKIDAAVKAIQPSGIMKITCKNAVS